MIVEHAILVIILILTSQPGNSFQDYINLKNTSIIAPLSSQSEAVVIGLSLFGLLFGILAMVVYNILSINDFEQAKRKTFSKRIISGFIGQPQNIDAYAYYIILFTLIPIFILYCLSLIVAFKMTQMPVPTKEYFWNCIYVQNLYIREMMKFLIMVSDSFVPSIRSNKFAIVSYFLILCALYGFLNFQRCFFYDHLVDRVSMYCLRAVLSIVYASLIRVIFELQLLEVLIFYPIIFFVVLQLFHYFEQKRRRGYFDMLQQIETLPQSVIQQIILQILQMIERQSLSDMRELQNILNRHQMNCFDRKCVCIKYYVTVIENFKDEQKLKSQKEYLNLKEIDDSATYHQSNTFLEIDNQDFQESENHTHNKLSQNDNERGFQNEDSSYDQNTIQSKMGISELRRDQLFPLKEAKTIQSRPKLFFEQKDLGEYFNPNLIQRQNDQNFLNFDKDQNLQNSKSQEEIGLIHDDQQNLFINKHQRRAQFAIDEIIKQNQHPGQDDKIDNFTFAFDNNHVAQGIQVKEFFKNISAIEIENKKIYDANQAPQHSTRSILQIQDMKFESDKHARKYFFIWLLEKIFKQYEQAQKQNESTRNVEFELLYINYINQKLEKHFLAIFQMLSIHQSKLNLKFFDRLLFSVSEQIMLEEAMKNLKNYFGGFDYSLFIDGNRQAIQLDSNYEKATGQIIDFWSKFKGNDVKIQQIMDLGVKISKRIYEIKKVTKLQEQSYAIRKDLGKYQLYAMFHLNMLYDPNTFDQMAQYLKNSLIFKTRKYLGHDSGVNDDSKTQVQQEMMDEKGICIAEGWNSNGKKGNIRFVFGNKTFCEMFKTTQLLLPGQNIDQIMPEDIKYHHGDMIYRFYKENKPTILGKLNIRFAKTFDGFLIPVQIRINFYYHPEFKYCFVSQFEKIRHMNMFNEEQTKISTEDCMFIMVDEYLRIQEFSSNFLTFVGISKHRLNMLKEITGENMKIIDIFMELEQVMHKEFGESVLPKDYDLSLVNKMVRCKKFVPKEGSFSSLETFPCILSYVQQPITIEYSNARLNIFMVTPLNRHPDYDGIGSSRSRNPNSHQIAMNSAQFIKSMAIPHEDQEKNEELQILIESLGSDDMSGIKEFMSQSSRSSNTSSLSSGQTSAFYTKSLLFQNLAPRVIKINLTLILIMIVSFLIINIYSLAIFLNKHSYISTRFDTYSQISQRNARLRASLLDMKMIQQITQNLTLYNSINYSNVLYGSSDRLSFYQSDLVANLDLVTLNANLFNQFMMSNQDMYSFDLQFNDVTFLTEQGNPYKQDLSYQHAINLFIAYASELSISDFISQKPLLNVGLYQKSNSTNASLVISKPLTALVETLYFLFENGLFKMSQLGQQQSFMLTETSSQQTNNGILTLNISTFVSIGIVTLIGIIIFPLVSKVIERQYSVIRFFNSLDLNSIDKILEAGKTFQTQLKLKIGKSLSDEAQYGFDRADSGSFQSEDEDGVTFSQSKHNKKKEFQSYYNQSIEEQNDRFHNKNTGNQNDNSKNNQENHLKNRKNTIIREIEEELQRKQKYQNSQDKYYNQDDSEDNSQKQKRQKRRETDKKKADKIKQTNQNIKNAKDQDKKNQKDQNLKLNKDIFEDLSDTEEKKFNQKNNSSKSKDNQTENYKGSADKENQNDKDKNIQRNFEYKSSKNQNASDKEKNTKKLDQDSERSEDQEQKQNKRKKNRRDSIITKNQDQEEIQQESNLDTNKNRLVAAQIQKLTFQKRFKIFVMIGLLILYLNSSLLVSFYQTQVVFSSDQDSASRMSKFYQREECAYDLLLFMREKLIQNQTLLIEIYQDSQRVITTSAVDYYITECYANEQDIQAMRQNLPTYLQGSQSDIEGLEQSQLCQLTFGLYINDPIKAASCATAMQGLLNKGLGNAMYYIIGYIQQMNFNQQSSQNQSQKYINELLNQQQYHQLSDLILFYLAHSFDFLQNTVIDAGKTYFNKAKDNYMLSFGLFMSVTAIITIIGGAIAFKKAKQSILDIQNMLILIPLDQIDPAQRIKLERYFFPQY